jgi:hypothetical protein
MKNLLWLLIILGVLAFLGGAVMAFTGKHLVLTPQGYWRGAMGFWMLAATLKLVSAEK